MTVRLDQFQAAFHRFRAGVAEEAPPNPLTFAIRSASRP